MITNILGSPSTEDKSFITDPQATSYIDNLPRSSCVDFQERFPAVGQDGSDFLSQLLQFNPYMRMKVDEALSHPFLESVRMPFSEKHINQVTKNRPIEIEIDRVNPDGFEHQRQFLMKEIMKFRLECK